MPPTDATPPPVQDTATTAPRTPSPDSARPIGVSTVLVSAFLLYLGYEPSTGTSLVFSRSLFMLAIGYGVLSVLSLAVKHSSHTRFVVRYVAMKQDFNIYLHFGPDFDITRNGGVNRSVTRGWRDMDGERVPANDRPPVERVSLSR